MSKPAVSLATLESHNHIVDDIGRGVKVYNQGGVQWEEWEPGLYLARVPHKGGFKTVKIVFTRDGQDLKEHFCDCTWRYKDPPVCRHVVAAALAIQGGVVESKIELGKTAAVSAVVGESNIASFIGSGSLPVFATPSMIALMEKAACACLEGALEPGQTSVGSRIDVEHSAASPAGAEITATAKIVAVFGRRIEYTVAAFEGDKQIGGGKHTRSIVEEARFMEKTRTKKV